MANPNSWPQWDPEVKDVQFDGPALLHAKGCMTPLSGPPSAFEITVLEPNAVLTTTSALPGARLSFEHVVHSCGNGAEVTVTLSLEGPLASVWRYILKRNLAPAAHSSVTGLIAHLDAQ